MIGLRSGLAACALTSLLSALWFTSAGAQAAQDSRTLLLNGAGARLTHPFSRVTSVRELGDGRVVITDEKESRLVIADFPRQTVTAIGRTGQGPGEYRQLARAWALGSDSTLIKEPFNARWLVLHGDKVVATLGPAEPQVSAFAPRGLLSGSSAHGTLLAVTIGRDAAGRPTMIDSLVLQRLDRRTARIDTVGRLRSAEAWSAAAGMEAQPAAERAATGGAPGRRRFSLGLQVPDQATMFADGWVAIARAKPYRVEWCSPEGRCRPGPELSGQVVRFTDREKRAYLAAAQLRLTWPPTSDPAEVSGWPAEVPPFAMPKSQIDGGALWPMPDGRLLIERTPTADRPSRRYDIVGRDGRVEAQLRLDQTRRVIGFGVRHVYVIDIDDNGLEHLSRLAWPP